MKKDEKRECFFVDQNQSKPTCGAAQLVEADDLLGWLQRAVAPDGGGGEGGSAQLAACLCTVGKDLEAQRRERGVAGAAYFPRKKARNAG